MRGAIYSRVSTIDQDYNRQTNELREFAKNNAIEVVYVFEEKESGFNNDRPEFAKLKELTKDDIDIVLVWELSRLSRRAIYLQQQVRDFADNGICVFSKKENLRTLDSDGREDKSTMLIVGIISMIAEQEVSTFKERSASSKKNKILKEGHSYTYKPPYGYDYDTITKMLTINNEESPTVKRTIELSANGYSSERIALILNAENIPTKGKVKKWTMGTINTLLANPVYKGKAQYMLKGTEPKKGKKYKRPIEVAIVDTPAIVSEELFDLSREKMKGRAIKSKSAGIRHFQLLRGLFYCPYCRIKYTYEGGRDLYVCHDKHKKATNKPKCFSKAIKANRFEKVIWKLVKTLYSKDLAADKALERIEPLTKEIEDNQKLIMDIGKKMAELTAEANSIINAAIDIKKELPNMPDLYMNKIKEAARLDKESKHYLEEKQRLEQYIVSCKRKIEAINSLSNENVLVETITDDLEKFDLIHKVIDHMVIYGEDAMYSLIVITFKTGQVSYIGYKSKGYQYYTSFSPTQSIWFDEDKRTGFMNILNNSGLKGFNLDSTAKEYTVSEFVKEFDIPENRRLYSEL